MSWGFLFALNNIGRAELPLDRCGNIWAAQQRRPTKNKKVGTPRCGVRSAQRADPTNCNIL
jgi:hypothetical protein